MNEVDAIVATIDSEDFRSLALAVSASDPQRVTSPSDNFFSPVLKLGGAFFVFSFLLSLGAWTSRLIFVGDTRSVDTTMARNKNKKPRPPPNQQRDPDWTGWSGRGGRGRGRGGRGNRGGGLNGGGGADDPLRWRGGFQGGGQAPPLNFRDGPPPFSSDYGFQGGRGRGRGGWVDRGRGFGAIDSGRFTWDFNSGRRVMYHPMDEIDFEAQQWSKSKRSPVTHTCFPCLS